MAKLKIAVLGSTKGTDMQAIIDAIEAGRVDAEIVAVGSDRKGAFILERAKKHKIHSFAVDYKKFPEREGAEKVFAKEFGKRGAELVLLIGFMKILSPHFIREFRGRVWNIHPSLLPKYAGGMDASVHETVLKNGDKETGCTLHEVAEEVDAGRVILQKKCKVEKGDAPETLKGKVQKLEQECLLEAIKMVIEGNLHIGK